MSPAHRGDRRPARAPTIPAPADAVRLLAAARPQGGRAVGLHLAGLHRQPGSVRPSDAVARRTRRGASRGSAAHARAHLCTRGALMRPKTFTVCAVPNVDASKRGLACTYPQPVYATAEEVRYAHELRLQLRARLLCDAAPQVGPWC